MRARAETEIFCRQCERTNGRGRVVRACSSKEASHEYLLARQPHCTLPTLLAPRFSPASLAARRVVASSPSSFPSQRQFPPALLRLSVSRWFSSNSEHEPAKTSLGELNQLLNSLTRPDVNEPRNLRAQRKARFNALIDTFHSATVCTPSEQEAALEEHFFEIAKSALTTHRFETGPNVLLQGVASSMTEPTLDPQTKQGAVADAQPPTETTPGKLVSAAALAKPFIDAITSSIEARVASGKNRPRLVGILAIPSPPSIAYAEWTKKACESVGMEFEIWRTWDQEPGQDPPNEDEKMPGLEDDVEDLIIAANADESVDGIMVYFPVFGGRQDTYLSQIIKPSKDVEGLSFSFAWNLYHNVRWIAPSQLGGAPGSTAEGNVLTVAEKEQVTASLKQGSGRHDHSLGSDDVVPPGMVKGILPCTPLAIVKCLEAMSVYDRSLPYGDRLRGKTITVVNRSEVVGRPLAALLANDGARVLSVDLDSIQEFSKRDAVDGNATDDRPVSKAVKEARQRNASSRLRPHHVVRQLASASLESCVRQSDVVISGVPSANFKIPTEYLNQGVVAVNFSSEKNFEKDVRTKASLYLPAVGKMTCTMLQRNLLRLVESRDMVKDGSGR